MKIFPNQQQQKMGTSSSSQTRAIVATLAILLSLATTINARQQYEKLVPNGDNYTTVIGHANGVGGSTRTSFGEDFLNNGGKWDVTLCNKDSDGDGFTNGQEMGDPGCVWQAGDEPARLTDLSHPGDATSKPPSSLTFAPTPAPPTPIPGSTPTPTTAAPARPENIPQLALKSGWFTAINDKIRFSWGMNTTSSSRNRATPSTNGDEIIVVMNVTGNNYGGMGWSTSQMDGPMVVCYASEDLSVAGCWDFDGDDYDVIAPKASRVYGVDWFIPQSQPADAGPGRTATFVFRIQASAVDVKEGSRVRVIFGQGAMVGTFPGPHSGGTDRVIGKKRVDFFGHTAEELKVNLKNTQLAWGISAAILVFILIIGAVLNVSGAGLRFANSPILVYVQILIILPGLSAFIIAMAHKDYKDAQYVAPVYRAFAQGSMFMFACLLLPVCKHSSIFRLAGMSYERQIPFHIMAGFLCLIFTTVHFAGIYEAYKNTEFGREFVTAWGNQKKINRAGLVSWCIMAFISLIAIFLRRKFFLFFRLTHFAGLLAIIFACIHHPPTAIAMTPGFVLYGIDLLALRWIGIFTLKPQVKTMHYHEAAGVTELEVQFGNPSKFTYEGGQYMFFDIVPSVLHPISIAWYDKENGVASFYVRNMNPDGAKADPAVKKWSTRLAVKAQQFDEEVAANGDKARFLLMMGPYGSPQVPLRVPTVAVLVSGGIGVTPMLSTLQTIANGEYPNIKHVIFVWTFRGQAMADMLETKLDIAVATAAAKNITLQLELHDTKRGKMEEPASAAPVASDSLLEIKAGRPNLQKLVDEVEKSVSDNLAIYVCGPQPLMDSARAVKTSSGLFHSETFEM